MTRIAVDLDELTGLVDRMALFSSQLAVLRDVTDARVRAVHATWSGEAAGAFAAALERWTSGAGEVHEALDVLRSMGATGHANYAAAIAANRRMWSH